MRNIIIFALEANCAIDLATLIINSKYFTNTLKVSILISRRRLHLSIVMQMQRCYFILCNLILRNNLKIPKHIA